MKNLVDQIIPQITPELNSESLLWILDHIFGNIFVTDGAGNILFVNQQTSRVLKKSREQLLQMHVTDNLQENGGVMSRSTTLETIEKKEAVMGGFTTADGVEYFSTSTPMLDSQGNLQLVLTYSQEKSAITTLAEAVEREHRKAENYKHALKYIRNLNSHPSLVFESPKMKELIKTVDQIIKLDSTVLICGESGTGKEVIANYIQLNSRRRDEPFIQVNCAAIPPNLMESEFFGYAKGAFTGANREGKPGVFEIANHGVLLLDEIGELPLELQGKLLRVLETSEFFRIGGTKVVKTDVRLLAATNQDLRTQVEKKLFREDLYYRLNVIPIKIPPLRERKEDIKPLALYFLDICNRKYEMNRQFSPEVIQLLERYTWPGNVRELRNIVERMILITTDQFITLENVSNNPILSENLGFKTPSGKESEKDARRQSRETHDAAFEESAEETMAQKYQAMQHQRVLDAMLATNGNKVKAAKLLGISPGKLYRLLDAKL